MQLTIIYWAREKQYVCNSETGDVSRDAAEAGPSK